LDLSAGLHIRQEFEQGAGVLRAILLFLCRFSALFLSFEQDYKIMDRYDARILSLLQKDGRISWSQLGIEINLSASACQRRVEALIDKGVIENFTVNLNENQLGHHVKAFVAVNMVLEDTRLAEDFKRRVNEHPQVQACHMISGSIDFMLEVVAADLDAFGNFIDGELLSMPAVKDASSSIVLKIVKPKQTMIN